MLELQYGQIKASVANVLSLCATDSRLASYVNRATQRLLYGGKWKGTVDRFQVCVTDGCLTWPRQLETIESVAMCGRPGTPRNRWFEFLPSGPGISGRHICGGSNLIDQPEACGFDNIKGTGKKLAVYTDKQEDPTGTITLQYWDKNGLFVTSTWNGQVIDGERIMFPPVGTYAYSSSEVMPGGWVRAYKDKTKGAVRIFEYETATALLRPLAYYERDETNPIYRRSKIPGFRPEPTSDPTTCKSMSVVVEGKLRFIPVSDDEDYLVISHPEAIRLACQAVLKEENGKLQEAAGYWAMARATLEDQLNHWRGDGAVAPVAYAHGHLPAVRNLI